MLPKSIFAVFGIHFMYRTSDRCHPTRTTFDLPAIRRNPRVFSWGLALNHGARQQKSHPKVAIG
jgi:hypothetical protein